MNGIKEINDNQLIYQGYLEKRTRLNQWKKKWVVLRLGKLSYYSDSFEKKPIKVFNRSKIRGFSIISLTCYIFTIYTHNSIVKLKCEEERSFRSWINGLEEFFGRKQEAAMEDLRPFNMHETRRESGSSGSSENSASSSCSSLSLRGRRGRLDDIHETDHDEACNVPFPLEKSQSPPINSKKVGETVIERGSVYLKTKKWIAVETVLTTKTLYFVDSATKRNIVTIPTLQLADVVDFESKRWLYLIAENHQGLRIGFSSPVEHIRWNMVFKAVIDAR